MLHHWPGELVLSWLAWARACGRWRWLVLSQDIQGAVDNADCFLGGYRALSHEVRPLSEVPELRPVARYAHKAMYLIECNPP